MRPVVHGGQGAYPYNVNVGGTQAELEESLETYEIPFLVNPLRGRIEAAFGTNSPDGLEIARALWDFYNNNPPQNFDAGLAASLKEKLRERYILAAGPLEANMGRFCSYCEGYFLAGLAVEHIAPKAPYPAFYLAWDNFLLACPSCNSLKGEQPPPGDPVFNPAPQGQRAYFNAIKNAYAWPQWAQGGVTVFRRYRLQLEYERPNGTWAKVQPGRSVGPQTEISAEEILTRTIRANISNGPQNVPVRVAVRGTSATARRLIALVNLNRPSFNPNRPGGESDIRVWERTKLWFEALDVLRTIRAAPTLWEFQARWAVMMMTIQRMGFYAVWVTVIDRLGPAGAWTVPGPPPNQPVMELFLGQITVPFPGTNIENTP